MTWSRITDAIPEFDTENADGGMTIGDQDGGVAEAGASGQDGGVVVLGNAWRRLTAATAVSFNQITTAVSSFIRL